MIDKGYLYGSDYAKLIEVAPVLCVDVDLQTADGQHVVFKRNNEPAKGEWWVLGGRVYKGETALESVHRKLAEEAGLTASMRSVPKFVGFYEDFWEFSSLGRGKYHTVSLVFEVVVADTGLINLDSQHVGWTTMDRLPHKFELQRSH